MYRTCLFCLGPLGTNDALETLPVGRTIAFDSARGRLWVVCPQCARWNLTPLEERWEAVEAAENRFRSCARRVIAQNIGLCILPDDTRLIRVGQVLPAEYAAWRYGSQLRGLARPALVTRWLRWLNSLVAGTVFAPGIYNRWRMIDRVNSPGGEVTLRRADLDGAVFRTHPETGAFQVGLVRPFAGPPRPWLNLEGDVARTLFERMLVSVNREASPDRMLAAAVQFLGRHESGESAFRSMGEGESSVAGALRVRYEGDGQWRGEWAPPNLHGYLPIPRYRTLALEMALHEDAERKALAGELPELLARWKDAERIASIADSL